MRKMLLVLISISVLLSANNNKKIILQLNWLNQFQFAGFYMAKEKGFYNDVGINIDIKEYSSKTNLVESIKTNKVANCVYLFKIIIKTQYKIYGIKIYKTSQINSAI